MLLDTASMYFRAFFGVPDISAPDGSPVNAVRGLMDMIARLVGQYHPSHLVCCWDNDWRPQWRVGPLAADQGDPGGGGPPAPTAHAAGSPPPLGGEPPP